MTDMPIRRTSGNWPFWKPQKESEIRRLYRKRLRFIACTFVSVGLSALFQSKTLRKVLALSLSLEGVARGALERRRVRAFSVGVSP